MYEAFDYAPPPIGYYGEVPLEWDKKRDYQCLPFQVADILPGRFPSYGCFPMDGIRWSYTALVCVCLISDPLYPLIPVTSAPFGCFNMVKCLAGWCDVQVVLPNPGCGGWLLFTISFFSWYPHLYCSHELWTVTASCKLGIHWWQLVVYSILS